MSKLKIFYFMLTILALSLSDAFGDDSLPPAADVSMIIVGFRHGYRNPAQFLPNDTNIGGPNGYGWEGVSQLTNIGKQQAFSLGKFLRNRYGKLIPYEFQTSQIKAVSSSAERCQMTLMCVMAGLFPPTGRSIWDRTLKWQPIPFSINDPLLRMYNVKCPTYTKAYQPISDDNLPESKEWLSRESDLVKYISKHTGFNGSLSDLADVADNIQSMIYNNAQMPAWLETPDLPGFDKQKLVKEILEYAEAHQIQCAVERPCARAMAGLWLNEIFSLLKQKVQGKLPDRRAHFYAAHTETVLSLMKLLGMNVAETPTSAGFVLELAGAGGGGGTPARVRALFHEPSPANHRLRTGHVTRLPCGGGGAGTADEPDADRAAWCPLDDLLRSAASADAFDDWQEFCLLPKCVA